MKDQIKAEIGVRESYITNHSLDAWGTGIFCGILTAALVGVVAFAAIRSTITRHTEGKIKKYLAAERKPLN